MTKRNLELVHWVDSHSASGAWIDMDKIDAEMPVQRIVTLGWVVFEDAERLILANSHDEDWKVVGEIISIVKLAITNRRRVNVGETPDGQVIGEVALRAVGE